MRAWPLAIITSVVVPVAAAARLLDNALNRLHLRLLGQIFPLDDLLYLILVLRVVTDELGELQHLRDAASAGGGDALIFGRDLELSA